MPAMRHEVQSAAIRVAGGLVACVDPADAEDVGTTLGLSIETFVIGK